MLSKQEIAGLRELLAKGPEAEGLRNCLDGSNYLRGSEYLRLAEIIEALPALLDIAEAVANAIPTTMTAGDNPETMESCAEILDVFPEDMAGQRVALVVLPLAGEPK